MESEVRDLKLQRLHLLEARRQLDASIESIGRSIKAKGGEL